MNTTTLGAARERRKAVDALDLEQKWQTQSRDTNDSQL
jgi:hypothetical protein